MADVKISGLPASTTPLAGTEVLPIVQGGQTRQVSVANLTAGRSVSATNFVPSSSTIPTNGMYLPATSLLGFATNSGLRVTIDSIGWVNMGNGALSAYPLNVQYSGGGSVVSMARFGTVGNGGAGRGAGIIIGASGAANSVDVAQIVGYQNTAAATANNAVLAFLVSDSSTTSLTERMRIGPTGGVSIGNTTDIGAGNLKVTGIAQVGTIQALGQITAGTTTASFFGYSAFSNPTAGTSTGSALAFNGFQSGNNNFGIGLSAFGLNVAGTLDIWYQTGSTNGGGHAFFNGTTQIGYIGLTKASVVGTFTAGGTISPQQATTAAAPAYVKGAIYFDTTLNKLRVGGATDWETVTSV